MRAVNGQPACNTAFDAVAYLNEPRWRALKPGLERIRALMEALGNPQDGMRFVHVAGTNGKGSTCAYLATILEAAHFKTGLFTSPFLERFEDRIRVNGTLIAPNELIEATLAVREAAHVVERALGEHPTEFELMCAVALVHFKRCGCDICVMECGLGGRLDATNIISPDVCVICRLGFDHTDILGDTLAEIAAEKAGIIKEGVRVVSWPQEREAMEVIEDVCEARTATLTMPDFRELEASAPDIARVTRTFVYDGVSYTTHLLGSCQPDNACVAIEAARALRRCGWHIEDAAIVRGIEDARWPARFELVAREPLVFVDGAHNPQGAEVLAESLREAFAALDRPNMKATFVMGVLADKDYEYMIAPLVPLACAFVTYAPDNPRALAATDLARAINRQVSADVDVHIATSADDAVRIALRITPEDGAIVACGSLYSAATIRKDLQAQCLQV